MGVFLSLLSARFIREIGIAVPIWKQVQSLYSGATEGTGVRMLAVVITVVLVDAVMPSRKLVWGRERLS